MPWKVAIVGAGRPWKTEGATGFGMSHRHWLGFKATGNAELVAVCDLLPDRARAYAQDHNPNARIYADAKVMMEKEKPDVACISLWPHLHAQVTCELAAFKPKGILCEKPMDRDWDAALRMHETCEQAGVALMINHQRRFNAPFLKMKELLKGGAIGKLLRLEAGWHNVADSGTHWLDMLFHLNDDVDAEWVLAQVDLRGAKKVFGALEIGHGIVTFRFKNGVRATFFAGVNHQDLGCMVRAIGDNGVLEVGDAGPKSLTLIRHGKSPEVIETPGEGIHDDVAIHRGIADFLDAIEKKRPALLGSRNALRATEITFAAYESAWRRGRVDLPLAPGPSALRKLAAEAGVEF